jgi:hypothetical protein
MTAFTDSLVEDAAFESLELNGSTADERRTGGTSRPDTGRPT